MFETVDLYCERLGPDLWAEPANTLTNASFLIAAWFAFMRAKHLDVLSSTVWVLVVLVCTIGIGSAFFHTVANNLARYADFLPILVFQLSYVWLYCHRVIGIRSGLSSGIIFGYFVAVILGRQFPDILNGSLVYTPAIVVMFVIGVYHAVAHRNERLVIIGAALVFVISLFARTVDAVVCPRFAPGTHFLWHLLNGLVLYLLMRGFLANYAMTQSPDNERSDNDMDTAR